MLESLNFHFSFYDWLLVFMVTALGTVSAYLKDPQLKAVTATIPIPFGFAYLAVGKIIDTPNVIAGFYCMLFANLVRFLTYKLKCPIVLSIVIGLAFVVFAGTFTLPLLPQGEGIFLGACLFDFLVGFTLFQKQKYQSGVRYKTPLPVYIKAPAIACVVGGLMVIKSFMQGFCTSFPMMNSIVSYESRFSLGDQCRQLPVFLMVGPLMFIIMRYTELWFGLNHWIVLIIGWTVFTPPYMLLNKELKRRNDINYNNKDSDHCV